MKLKAIIAFLLALVCALMMFSCAPADEPADKDGDSTNKEEFIYNSETQITLVYDPSTVPQKMAEELKNSIALYVGGVTLSDGTTPKTDHEIILGEVDRPLSTEAYKRIGIPEEEGNVSYCIYSDGTSVAIAYDDPFYGYHIARDAAIEDFLVNYVKSGTLKLKAGVVVNNEINAVEYQEGVDRIDIEKQWANISAKLTEEHGSEIADPIVEAFRGLYNLYTDDMIDWFANLYDPVTGGFYYSNSSRNSDGYLPDLESTNQTLGFIATSGMIEGSIKDFIPEDMQKKIVAFVKGLQDPINGYFYHPQWERADSDAHPERLGRDVNNAVRTLAYFGHIPLYDAPDGTKGENPLGTAPASKLTGRLSASKLSAVSKVVPASGEAGVPDYLLNEKNFSDYLASYNERIKSDAYWVGNLFESMASQIVQRDKVLAARGETYSLAKMATDWLTSHQDPETGLWEEYEGQEYDCVNGILKISSAYSKMGYPVPNALKLLNYAVDAITSTADPHHVCCVLNTWYAITVLSTNISSFSPTAEADIAKIKEECIPNYAKMIKATSEKYSLFVKDQGSSKGGFSYFQNKTSNLSQGMKVALDNVNEADVNSTYICSSGAMGHIFGFVGLRAVDLFTPADGLRFLMTVDSLGPIIKNAEIPPEPIDFEDEVTVDQLYGDGVIDTWLPGGELIVEDGFPYGQPSRVMRLTTQGKDLFQLFMTKAQGSFNAVAFESDVMFAPVQTSTFELLMLGSQGAIKHVNFMLKAVPDDGVYISSADFPDLKIAECGSWFNLRVEYGKLNSTSLQVDIYVNDVLKATCKTPYSGEALDANTLTRIQFSAYHAAVCDGSVYFDNMFLEQFLMKLPVVPDEDYGPSEEETGILNFDRKSVGAYYNQNLLDSSVKDGQLSIVDGKPFDEDSKVLMLTTSMDSDDLLQVKTTKTLDGYNALKFQAAMMFNNPMESSYELLIFGASSKRGYNLFFESDSTGVYVSSYDLEKTKVAEAGEWFNFSVVYTKVDNNRICAEVSINNERLTIDTTPYDPDVIPAVNEVYRIQLSASSLSVGAVYLDNVGLTQIEYVIPELPGPVGPELPPVPDSPFEGGNVGDDDWT